MEGTAGKATAGKVTAGKVTAGTRRLFFSIGVLVVASLLVVVVVPRSDRADASPIASEAVVVEASSSAVESDTKGQTLRVRPPDREKPKNRGKGKRTTTTTEATTTTSTVAPTTTSLDTTTSTASPTTATTQTTTVTTQPPPPPSTAGCTYDDGGSRQPVDFAALAAAGSDAAALNATNDDTYFRTVYALETPREMDYVDDGLRLRFDVADQPATGDWTNAQSRSEMRVQQIDVAPTLGSTVAYCMTFIADHPNIFGPTTIFQAFSRELDEPLLGIELTGINQFYDAVANELQVVSVDGRHRIANAQLDRSGGINNLLVVLHYDVENKGSYLVSLNGRTLRSSSGISTWSSQGVWWQFGLYAHGMKDGSGRGFESRQEQLASGSTRLTSTYQSVERVVYEPGRRSGGANLDGFGTEQ